jgi:hypothetical protein
MEEKILAVISDEMSALQLNYHYMTYKPEGETIYPYITGEYSETDYVYEDGHIEGGLLLEVWTRSTWTDLSVIKEAIRKHFKDFRCVKDGVAIYIAYNSSNSARAEDGTLKKKLITLDIQAWESEDQI